MKIDTSKLDTIDFKGKGGKEKLISLLLPNSKRKSSSLYDIEQENDKIELKKQEDLQWFDVGKYGNLSDEDKSIIMLFVFHKKGKCNQISSIPLGTFIDILTSNDKYAKDGWPLIEELTKRKAEYPRLQTKAGVKMKDFVKEHESQFSVHYQV